MLYIEWWKTVPHLSKCQANRLPRKQHSEELWAVTKLPTGDLESSSRDAVRQTQGERVS